MVDWQISSKFPCLIITINYLGGCLIMQWFPMISNDFHWFPMIFIDFHGLIPLEDNHQPSTNPPPIPELGAVVGGSCDASPSTPRAWRDGWWKPADFKGDPIGGSTTKVLNMFPLDSLKVLDVWLLSILDGWKFMTFAQPVHPSTVWALFLRSEPCAQKSVLSKVCQSSGWSASLLIPQCQICPRATNGFHNLLSGCQLISTPVSIDCALTIFYMEYL